MGANLSNIHILDYFRSSANIEVEKETSRVVMQIIHNELSNVFTGIGCFEGNFELRVKEGSHLYQALSRGMACALQQPLKKELDGLQGQQIILLLDVDKTLVWYNSFVLVLKTNGKI